MTLDLENRLWQQLEVAAGREASRGRVARGAAGVRSAIRPRHLRPVAALIAFAAVAVLVIALAPNHARPQWHVERFGVAGVQLGVAVSGHGALWSFDEQSGQVLRLDPRSHRVVARVALPGSITDAALATGLGAVWVAPAAPIRHSSPAPAHPRPAALLRIDPRTNRVVARVVLRAPDGSTLRPVDMVAVAGALWVWGEGGAQRIDPSRNRVAAAIRIPGEKVMGFAATGHRVSVTTDFGQVVAFDAGSGDRLGASPLTAPLSREDLVPIGDDVVVYRRGGALVSTDPVTWRDRWAVHVGSQPRDVTMTGGRLWVLLAEPGGRRSELRALDPGTGRVVTRIALPVDDAHTITPAGVAPLVTTQSGDLVAVRPPP